VKKHLGERTVIFTDRTKNAYDIYYALCREGIQASMYVKDMDTLFNYENHKTDILILVKSLREAWDDPTISVLIMNSLTTKARIMIQTIGRALRKDPNNPKKHAHIYLNIADGTSDINVKSSLDYPK
jgi:superfamily II DNA or RNA helicase